MDSMEVNKAIASVLVAGIAFMAASLVADGLVHPTRLKQPAIQVELPKEPGAAPAPAAAPEPPIAALLASASPELGKQIAERNCAVCHSFDKGGKAAVGPNLWGVVGGPHAHMAGFDYSSALKSKQGPWTYDELNEWLTKPSAYAPGTRMTFAGLPKESERAAVIAWLRTLSDNPEPLPASTTAPAKAEETGNSQAGTAAGAAPAPQQTPAGNAAAAGTSAEPAQGGAPATGDNPAPAK